MKTLIDLQEKMYEAGDIMAELITSKTIAITEVDESYANIIPIRIEGLYNLVYLDRPVQGDVQFCSVSYNGVLFRSDVNKQLWEFLYNEYKTRRADALKKQIADAQEKLNKIIA